MKKPAAPATTTPTVGRFEVLARELIDIPKWNPRQHVAEEQLAELAESITRNGFHGTLTVRPIEGGRYELVAGQRRLLAAERAGLLEVPCIVSTLTDEAAFDIALVENNQRVDLHPLEEADAFQVKVQRFGRTPEAIAEQIGRSVRYVAQRMRLLELAPGARAAFADGKFGFNVALQLARIADADEQRRTLEDLLRYGDGEMSAQRAADTVLRRLLVLERAPFDLGRADLVPAAGPCTTCPHNTATQRALFDDGQEHEARCTKASCHKEKVEAHARERIAAAKSAGIEVASAAEAKKLMPYSSGLPSGYVRLDSTCYQDPSPRKRTYAQLLAGKGKAKAEVKPDLVVRSPHTGEVFELVKEKGLKARLRTAGHDWDGDRKRASAEANTAERERERKEREKHETEKRVAARLKAIWSEKLSTVAGERKPDRSMWLVFCQMLVSIAMDYAGESAVLAARGIWLIDDESRPMKPGTKILDRDAETTQVLQRLDRMKEFELRGLAFSLLEEQAGGAKAGWLRDKIVAWSGLDGKELERQARADVKATRKAAEKSSAKGKGTTKDRKSVAAGDADDTDDDTDDDDEKEPAAAVLTPGVCRICRCSEHDACGPTIAAHGASCAWVDDSETLCTSCVDHQDEQRDASWSRIVKEQRLTVHHIVERWHVSLAEVDAVLLPAASKSKAKKA